jgi:hypothetical protein
LAAIHGLGAGKTGIEHLEKLVGAEQLFGVALAFGILAPGFGLPSLVGLVTLALFDGRIETILLGAGFLR